MLSLATLCLRGLSLARCALVELSFRGDRAIDIQRATKSFTLKFNNIDTVCLLFNEVTACYGTLIFFTVWLEVHCKYLLLFGKGNTMTIPDHLFDVGINNSLLHHDMRHVQQNKPVYEKTQRDYVSSLLNVQNFPLLPAVRIINPLLVLPYLFRLCVPSVDILCSRGFLEISTETGKMGYAG